MALGFIDQQIPLSGGPSAIDRSKSVDTAANEALIREALVSRLCEEYGTSTLEEALQEASRVQQELENLRARDRTHDWWDPDVETRILPYWEE